MNRIPAILVIAMLSVSYAVAAPGIIDQQSPSGPGFGGTTVNFGQSFTPTFNGIDFIEFELQARAANVFASVDILNGVTGADGLDGGVLGTSNLLLVPLLPDGTYNTVHFDFASTVGLTPGNVYVAVLRQTPGQWLAADANSTNPYAGGQALADGFATANLRNDDFVFREGIHNVVPEPSTYITWGIMGLVGTCLYWKRRKK